MDVQNEKFRLIEWLVGLQDVSILRKVAELRNESVVDSEDITFYIASGEALTRTEYISEIKSAELQMKNGEFMSHDEVKKSVAGW